MRGDALSLCPFPFTELITSRTACISYCRVFVLDFFFLLFLLCSSLLLVLAAKLRWAHAKGKQACESTQLGPGGEPGTKGPRVQNMSTPSAKARDQWHKAWLTSTSAWGPNVSSELESIMCQHYLWHGCGWQHHWEGIKGEGGREGRKEGGRRGKELYIECRNINDFGEVLLIIVSHYCNYFCCMLLLWLWRWLWNSPLVCVCVCVCVGSTRGSVERQYEWTCTNTHGTELFLSVCLSILTPTSPSWDWDLITKMYLFANSHFTKLDIIPTVPHSHTLTNTKPVTCYERYVYLQPHGRLKDSVVEWALEQLALN